MATTSSTHSTEVALALLCFTIRVNAQSDTSQPAPPLNGTFADKLPGSQVVCTPTNWYDIVWFYFANYVLHALSVRSLPGENLFASMVFKLACLMIPYTGIRRGLCLISRSANFTRNDFQSAARANALCMIVRGSEWRPTNGQTVPGCTIEEASRAASPETLSPETSNTSEKELEKTDTRTEVERSKAADKEAGPIVRIKRIFTMRSNTTDDSTLRVHEAENEDRRPFKERLKDKFTGPIARSTEDKSGCIAFKTTDCYVPPPAKGPLEKTYRLLVESFRFGQSSLGRSIRLDPEYVKVHGLCNMPNGYELVYVPADIRVYARGEPRKRPKIMDALRNRNLHDLSKALTSSTRLASTQNAPRILFSLTQTVSGAWSLYRAQGLQIERFGFAAYGLTVLPYMIVSCINFAGSLLTKEYDMVYLVHSSIMDEMVSRGGSVDGVIGSVEPPEHALAEPVTPLSISAVPSFREPPSYLQPEGETLNFKVETQESVPETLVHRPPSDVGNASAGEDDPTENLAYRLPLSSDEWSETYKVTTIPVWKPKPLDSITWGQDGWREFRKKKRRKQGRETGDEPAPGLTVIHVPSHGPMIRLPPPVYEPFLQALTLALLIAAMATPFIVITILTGWKANHSQSSHRSFVMNWLVCGIVLGYCAGTVEKLSGNSAVMKGLFLLFLSYGSYCISGFVTVAQQMIEIGKCTAL